MKNWNAKLALRGALIYAIGDTIAALLRDEFLISRLLGIFIVGGTIYALEINAYFAWIENKTISITRFKKLIKASLALAYFNPLWIARHLAVIIICSYNYTHLNSEIFEIAFWSFLYNIPISILANYIIQNSITFEWRFIASALYSGLMAIYYALSTSWFS
jgi:hypothetical protein